MKEYAFIHENGQVPDSLRAVPFLGSFDDEQLDDVLNSSSYIHCDIGDAIIEEGAIDSRIYILLSGAVDVCKGGKVVATITRPGEVFGELAVVNEDRRSASVIASKPAVCLAVDQKFLQDVKPREEYPSFYATLYEFIARVTASRLQATSRRLGEVERELRELKASLAEGGSSATEPASPALVTQSPVPAEAKVSKPKPKAAVPRSASRTKLPATKAKLPVKAKAKAGR